MKDWRSFARSSNDSWLGGVCGGLGELFGIPSWAIRLVLVLTVILVHGYLSWVSNLIVITYLLLCLFVPLR